MTTVIDDNGSEGKHRRSCDPAGSDEAGDRCLSAQIDAFAAYCSELEKCYFLPYELFERRTHISPRLGSARNNQQLGINWASRYEFEATLGRLGAVAQLGERQLGMLEVTGSSPVGSIGT